MEKMEDLTNPIKELGKELRNMMTELFGECTEINGVLRCVARNMGVVNIQVVVDVAMEGGLNERAPYGLLHFHTTMAENIPDEVLPDLLISLNGLNHVINAGAMPGFGCFCYYEPLKQVYLSYRMPVNLNNIEAEYDNIRYYLACLYDQMDIFADFLMFTIVNPGGMTISDYMDYLDNVSDLNELTERMNVLEQEFLKAADKIESGSEDKQ